MPPQYLDGLRQTIPRWSYILVLFYSCIGMVSVNIASVQAFIKELYFIGT